MGLTGFFGIGALSGRHSLEARGRLLQRLPLLEQELARLDTRRSALRSEVDLLSLDPPAYDMIEGIARRNLGFAYPDETVVLTPVALTR